MMAVYFKGFVRVYDYFKSELENNFSIEWILFEQQLFKISLILGFGKQLKFHFVTFL